MFFFDPAYFLFVMIPALIISGLAQMAVSGAYRKWRQHPNSRNMTGVDTARMLMNQYNLNVNLEGTQQELGDHFDPRSQVVRLSPGVARQPSVASMAIAAHEFGHVQQYAQSSPLITARSFILPVARFGNSGAFVLLLIGLFTGLTGLAWLGVLLFAFATLFTILTLPIEFDASRRAMKMLNESGILQTRDDRSGAQAVLRAAALTYVAAMIVSLLNLAYYAMLVAGMGRD
jgi:hypothetical protein